jgi:membrane protease YdiL (CAAX protease family)
MIPVVVALKMDASRATALLLGTAGLFIGLYVARPLRSRPRVAAQLRLRSPRRYLPWLTVAVAMKLLFGISGLVLHEQLAAQDLLPRLPDDSDLVSAAFLADPLGPVAVFLAVAVLAPLIEEFAFRGRMQHALEHSLGVLPAIVLSTLAFSVLHGRIDAVHHIAFGLFAGWVVWRTGSIWTAAYMHAVNNGVAMLASYIPGDVPLSSSQLVARLWPYAILAGVLAAGGLVAAGKRIHRLAAVERPNALAVSWKRSSRTAVSPAS